ncbi:MAG: hypothetical protein ACXVXO_12500 [Mycobacteriaceae bacterium]
MATMTDLGHVGWPVDPAEALERIKRGLPVYWPRDPKTVDQTPYRTFAATRGSNSE